jgi:hypothetical protein
LTDAGVRSGDVPINAQSLAYFGYLIGVKNP